jgi:hypothetical protein
MKYKYYYSKVLEKSMGITELYRIPLYKNGKPKQTCEIYSKLGWKWSIYKSSTIMDLHQEITEDEMKILNIK